MQPDIIIFVLVGEVTDYKARALLNFFDPMGILMKLVDGVVIFSEFKKTIQQTTFILESVQTMQSLSIF